MNTQPNDGIFRPTPTVTSSNQNQQPFQQQSHQQQYHQPYQPQQQQHSQYQFQTLQHRHQQETAPRTVSQYGSPGHQAQVQGSPLVFSQQIIPPELPPRPALYSAPPPPQIPLYNPSQHQTPGYQPSYAQTSQASSSSASQPHSFQTFPTSAQGTLGQQPPSSALGSIGRIGASLSRLIQAKVQGHLDHIQGSQAPSPSSMPTFHSPQASNTQMTQALYPGSISSQPQSMHKPTTENQYVQPSINSSGTYPTYTLPAHCPSPSPYSTSLSNAGTIHIANPASPWLAPGLASSPYSSPPQPHIQRLGDKPTPAPTQVFTPPSNMTTAVQASYGAIAGATPSLVVPPVVQPQPESMPSGQVDTRLNVPPAQSSVYPALSTPETSISHPTSALLQPIAPALELTGSKTPSPQVGTALAAQAPGVIPPPAAQVQPLLPAIAVPSIPPQLVPIQPPVQGQTQQHLFIPPAQERQVQEHSGPEQGSLASAPQGLPTTPAVSAASSTPAALPQTSSGPTSMPSASRASKLPSLANLAAKIQQKLVLEVPIAVAKATDTSAAHNASYSSQDYVNEDEYNELPMLEGPVVASRDPGAPAAVSRLCFYTVNTSHEKEWHVHPEAPDFLTCSYCYHNHVRNSPFASAFSTIHKKALCSFHFPRMTKCLWPDAVRTGNLSAVTAFMSAFAKIPACKGTAGAVMSDHVNWFAPADDEIPGFVACESCHEGIIMSTSFRGRFIPCLRPQGPNDKWSCDMSLEFMWRTLLWRARQNDWLGFVEGANKRMAMEECKRLPKSASQNKWYCIRGESPQVLRICETCYADNFARSRFEGIFSEVEELPETKYSIVKCDWKINLPLTEHAFACIAAKRSPAEMRAGIVAIASKPRCGTEEGIVGGKWYNFPRQIGNFGICEACYIGFMSSTGAAACLSPKTTVLPSAAYCVFNVFYNRWDEFIDRYNEAIDIGVMSGFEDHARKWVSISTCARQNAVAGRAWYGWPDCPICPDCYETFAADTSLAATLPLQNTYSDEEKACCMYSPRQRERYTEACTLGSADRLLEASRERQAVWLQTIPVLKELKDRLDAELQAAAVQRQISANYLCTDMMGSVSGSNSYVYAGGGYKSWDGVMSDQAWNSAMAMQQRAANPARIQEMVRLENLWAQYD
ncbi:hypothetical protein B0J13DRAFT_567840 [Dactylonectria estremocensis]|uniref:Integral membrane protein n=1 Tax=Dactylonectria estremocensis TaxID=1079267 RepID=A0A9P9IIB3_9HYPO|nr:hypothetical protein B0J13DRAFT_567840 [Dactylonectria estremocensis]